MLKAARLLALAVTVLTGCIQPSPIHVTVIPPPREQWQYACMAAHIPGDGPEDVASKANMYGRDGWELAASDGAVWCFKRAVGQGVPGLRPAP
jgi:hypothetical protein